MSLLPADVASGLPAIGSDPWTPMHESRIYARLFDAHSNWQWLVMESDGQGRCFGLILSGSLAVAGQFHLSELEALADPDGSCSVRWDPEFEPVTAGELGGRIPAVREFLAAPIPRELNAGAGLVQLE